MGQIYVTGKNRIKCMQLCEKLDVIIEQGNLFVRRKGNTEVNFENNNYATSHSQGRR